VTGAQILLINSQFATWVIVTIFNEPMNIATMTNSIQIKIVDDEEANITYFPTLEDSGSSKNQFSPIGRKSFVSQLMFDSFRCRASSR
jgi:hypothetical protein